VLEPVDDGGEHDGAAVGDGVLVVAAGDAAPVLDAVEEALDDVAALVVLDVVADRSAAGAAAASSVADLVGWLWDDGLDASGAQQSTVRARGVGLVASDRLWGGPGSARSAPGDPQLCEQQRQDSAVTGLTRSKDEREQPAASVDEGVALGAQPSAGPADAVIVRFVPADRRILVIR
jgi:hypothetical protein